MPESLNVVFAGTPDFAVPCLEAVAESGHRLVAVYTQPDRPAGRGRKLKPSSVKERALEVGVPVYQPETLKETKDQDELAGLQPDLMVVVAYGLILPRAVLDAPTHGCWNVHASLLPRWRGAAPIQRAIASGDKETGVCLMQMAAGLDTGPVLDCRSTPIGNEETAGELHERLALLGAELLAEHLALAGRGELPDGEPQDDEQATYAAKITTDEATLDWHEPAEKLARLVRAFNPVPGARGEVAGETVKVWRARPDAGQAEPGQPVVEDGRLFVGTGQGRLEILEVQRPGKRPVTAREYLNARRDLGRG
jgi:methionyl-tRNA formyltransferase